MKNIKNLLFIFLFVIILFVFLFFISIKETFDNNNNNYYYNKTFNYPKYSHTVNMPINTFYDCQNKCSGQAKCFITGEQCTSDTDCQGCILPIPPYKDNSKKIVGNNDAGKYSFLVPQYSQLTTDIGTQASLYNKNNKFPDVPPIYAGPVLWEETVNLASDINKLNSSYLWDPLTSDYKFLPKYPTRKSTTGLFNYEGPIASNGFL